MSHRAAVIAAISILLIAGALPLECSGNQKEPQTDAFVNPQAVTISGFSGSAMEPFISPDGKFLFFNSDEDSAHAKRLYFAVRTGPLGFRCLGELPGANADAPHTVDGAPSIDAQGHFFFTSTRQYDKDFHATFMGDFDGKNITNLRVLEGNMNPKDSPGLINMDVSISPDGNTLYISRTRFGLIFHQPRESKLMIARRNGDRFDLDPDGADILKNVNTEDFEYAPDISADGLELYFTRASEREGLRIMLASRDSTDKPFGMPCVISAARGFVEAPGISLNGKELFFHEKVNDRFVIFRAERNPAMQNITCSGR